MKKGMTVKYLFIINLLFLTSCMNEDLQKTTRIKGENGIISEGKVFRDSLFDGQVKYYDTLNNYLGYSTFKYGIKEGIEVWYFNNGKVSDSLLYHNNMKNGFASNYNEKGIIKYKSHYLNDRPFGPIYEYDSIGKISHYYFTNFERKIIFESVKKDSIEFHRGEMIQANIYTSFDGVKEKEFIFLYLFSSPFITSHYEIGILNSEKEILSSNRILSQDCYYEQELKDLPNGNKYAIILHTYNPLNQKDDLGIRVIE